LIKFRISDQIFQFRKPFRQTGAKVGFSLPGKKQVQGQNLLIIHEILTIILCGEKNAPSNKILFSEINTTFAHLVCHLLPGRLVISRTYPVHFGKNQLRAQVLNPDGCRAFGFLRNCFKTVSYAFDPATSTSFRSITGTFFTTMCMVLRMRSSNSTIFPFFRLSIVSCV